MLCVRWWISTKAESQWPAGEDRRVAVATSGSTRSIGGCQRPYRYLRCGDPRSPGVTERRNGPLGLYVMMMIDVPVARLLGERDLRTRRRS